ncbi:peptidylprolyl isomerase [Paludisphaera sp.]|uniref:peptidylprolyl isomerase n=1 Tax=Paludisphaera sp. TaxID=2017432 RepID=UPI00301D385E
MRRTLLAAALAGLAVGGCAHSKSARPPEIEGGPVGMEPTPSIYDTINRGTSPSVAKSTLPDPANPNWSGAPLIATRPETGLAPRAAADPNAAPAAARAAAPAQAQAPVQAQAAPTTRWSEPPQELPADATAAQRVAMEPDLDDDEHALPPAVEADPDEALPTLPDVAPAPAPAPTRPQAAPAVEMEDDPLLGPNPDLMPAMEPSPPAEEDPPLGFDPDPRPATEPSPPADPAVAEPAPAKPASPKPAPPLEAAPDEDEEEPLPPLEAAPSASADSAPAPRVDAMVRQVSTTSAPTGADVDDSGWKQAGMAAARVGDEVVTLGELRTAVKEAVQRQGGKVSELSREELNYVAQNVLATLIDRTLMVQEAKHKLKNDEKQLLRLQEAADGYWREYELPPLLRQHYVQDEHQLRRKFEREGRSLPELQSNFRQEFVAHSFMMQMIGDRVDVGLPEMLKYYEEHKNDERNHRQPAIIWREILVDKTRHATPAEARAKADALLARVRRGEDFAAVAAAESEAPALIKAAGGLMETAPGGYVVAAVNRAIEALPLDTVSDVVEGPDSFHVLRVEARRPGGPASFAELQDSIRAALRERKTQEQRRLLLASLRKKTIVTTIFDGTASDPNHVSR